MRNLRKLTAWMSAITLMLTLAACGGSGTQAEADASAADNGSYTIGI